MPKNLRAAETPCIERSQTGAASLRPSAIRNRQTAIGTLMIKVGIDTGGTFTDFILVDGERIRTLKLLSQPDDPARAVLEGLQELLENRAG